MPDEPEEPAGPKEPNVPPGVVPLEEEMKLLKQIVLETRNYITTELPKQLKDYDENVQKREDAKLSKLMDDVINAVSKEKAPNASAGTTPPGTQIMGINIDGLAKTISDVKTVLEQLGIITPSEGGVSLDVDFKDLATALQRQTVLNIKNDWRKKLGLPLLVEHEVIDTNV